MLFNWQVHSGICILKPYQRVQSKHYGPGMLSLSSHGLWLITIAKGGILCIRDVHTLVSYPFFLNLGVLILISYKEQRPSGKEFGFFINLFN